MDYVIVISWAFVAIGLVGTYVWSLNMFGLIGGTLAFAIPFVLGLVVGRKTRQFFEGRKR
jgi:hypothetical protein